MPVFTKPARRPISVVVAVLALLVGVSARSADAAPQPGPRPEDGAAPLGANDWDCHPSAAHPEPLVLVHGLGATGSENWGYMAPMLKNAGYCVFTLTYGETPDNPYFGGLLPMQESAKELGTFVDRVLAATGRGEDRPGRPQRRHRDAAVVAEEAGRSPRSRSATSPWRPSTTARPSTAWTRSSTRSRALDGPRLRRTSTPGFDQGCGSCQQFLNGSDFYKELYPDGPVAAPGVLYTKVMTRYDELVIPYTSGACSSRRARPTSSCRTSAR